MKTLRLHEQNEKLTATRAEFNNGRKELVGSPGYGEFRVTLIRDLRKAEAMMRSSPECVLFAACMMSNIESPDTCDEAADLLRKVAKDGVPVGHALHVLAGVMVTDEFHSIRTKAAEIIATHAEITGGRDIAKIQPALEAALSDGCSEVHANARRALQAADLVS